VAEGRDMGTIVFPNADLKIFLTASPEERAKRRYQERLDKGESADYEGILKQVIERDNHDSTRNVAPLRQAEDALLLDSTGMPFDVVVAKILQIAKERGVA
jgi:cytidylate kinase (EC 2.7.4.14)